MKYPKIIQMAIVPPKVAPIWPWCCLLLKGSGCVAAAGVKPRGRGEKKTVPSPQILSQSLFSWPLSPQASHQNVELKGVEPHGKSGHRASGHNLISASCRPKGQEGCLSGAKLLQISEPCTSSPQEVRQPSSFCPRVCIFRDTQALSSFLSTKQMETQSTREHRARRLPGDHLLPSLNPIQRDNPHPPARSTQ